MIITIQNYLSTNTEEGNVINFLDRLNDRIQINKASASMIKATWDYIKYKNQFLNVVNDQRINKDKLEHIEEKLKDAVYRRVKWKKLFKNLIQ